MTVYYANNNRGGGLGNGLGIVGTLLSLVPGMQGVGAGIGALGSAINGDYTGAAMGAIKAANSGKPAPAASPTANTPNTPIGAGVDYNSPDYLRNLYREYNLGR